MFFIFITLTFQFHCVATVATTVKRKKKRQKQTTTISPANTFDEDHESLASFSPSNDSSFANEPNDAQQLKDSSILNTSFEPTTISDNRSQQNIDVSVSTKVRNIYEFQFFK